MMDPVDCNIGVEVHEPNENYEAVIEYILLTNKC